MRSICCRFFRRLYFVPGASKAVLCIQKVSQWMIVLLDVLFWIDMVMAFRSGFIEKPMTIRMESIHIVKRYLSCFFWIDLIANFPYLAIADGPNSFSMLSTPFLLQAWQNVMQQIPFR